MNLSSLANALRHQREYVCLSCQLRTSSTSRRQRSTRNAFSTRVILPSLSPAVAASLYSEIDKLNGEKKVARLRKREAKAEDAELRALCGKDKQTPIKGVSIAEPNTAKAKGHGSARKTLTSPTLKVVASNPQNKGHDSQKAAQLSKLERREKIRMKKEARRLAELPQTEGSEEGAESRTREHAIDEAVVLVKRRKVGETRAKRRAQLWMKARAVAAQLEQNAEKSNIGTSKSFRAVPSKDAVAAASQTGPAQEGGSDSIPVRDEIRRRVSAVNRSSKASPMHTRTRIRRPLGKLSVRKIPLSKFRLRLIDIESRPAVRRVVSKEVKVRVGQLREAERERIRLLSLESAELSSESPTVKRALRKPGERRRFVGENGTNLRAALPASKAEIKEINAMDLEIQSVPVAQLPVPNLAYGLERVLFNPGVYQLQDPRSRVYNFDPYLQKIMPASEFDFTALKEYITSSRDTSLISIAEEQSKRYVGSSSSMTGVLAQFHFLLSQWREINTSMISRGFPDKLKSFTVIQRAPSAIFLRWKDGTYAIDADKMFDTSSILSMLGKSMEKLLTLRKEEFERYRKSSSEQVPDQEWNARDSFHYSTMGDFLMRSQLDAHDPRLPGTGMFDLKTRSVVTVRMDVQDPRRGAGYEIQSRLGEWESYEREYYDMIRSAFLKYSLQVRMGRMDGIFVAFHNTERIFGFQYVSLEEMDDAVHGQSDTTLGDQEFKLSLELLNKILDRATEKFPGQSIRMHFETREAVTPFMYIFAEPVTERQIEEMQSTNAAKIEEFEREINGLSEEVSVEDYAEEEDKKWGDAQARVDEAIDKDGNSGADLIGGVELSSETVCSGNYTDGTEIVASHSKDADESITNLKDHHNDEVSTGDVEEGEEIIGNEDTIIEEESTNELGGPVKENEATLKSVTEEEMGEQIESGLEKTIKEELHGESEEPSNEGEKLLAGMTEKWMEQHRVKTLEEQREREDQLQADAEHETEDSATFLNGETDQEHQVLDAQETTYSKPQLDQGSSDNLQYESPMSALLLFGQSLKAALVGPKTPQITPLESDLSTTADATFLNTINPPPSASVRSPLLAMILTIRNKVDDKYILRPTAITRKTPPPPPKSENATPPPAPKLSKKWTVEYTLAETPNEERAWTLYEACQARRRKALNSDDEGLREKRSVEPYMRMMRELHENGRRYRERVDRREGGMERVVLGMENKGGKKNGTEGGEEVE